MDTTEAIAVAEECIQVLAHGDRADFDRLVHPEAIDHEAKAEPLESRIPGPAGYYASALRLRTAFADFTYDIHYVVTEWDLVALKSTVSGRHVAPYAVYDEGGAVEKVFPPTGKTFAVSQSHWVRVRDGQAIALWGSRDDDELAAQLGWTRPGLLYRLKMRWLKRSM